MIIKNEEEKINYLNDCILAGSLPVFNTYKHVLGSEIKKVKIKREISSENGFDVIITSTARDNETIKNTMYGFNDDNGIAPVLLLLELQAPGGGGGSNNLQGLWSYGGLGGGSGAYSCLLIDLLAADSYEIDIGEAGSGGNFDSNTSGGFPGNNGGDITVKVIKEDSNLTVLTLYGGEGGLSSSTNSQKISGGQGGNITLSDNYI